MTASRNADLMSSDRRELERYFPGLLRSLFRILRIRNNISAAVP